MAENGATGLYIGMGSLANAIMSTLSHVTGVAGVRPLIGDAKISNDGDWGVRSSSPPTSRSCAEDART